MSSDEEGTRSEEEGSGTKKVKLDEATLATIVDRVTITTCKRLWAEENRQGQKRVAKKEESHQV